MPKSPLKKSAGKKPTAAKAKKPTAKKAAPKKAVKAAPAHEHKGFMWKLLERKQMELKRTATHPRHPYAHADSKPGEPYSGKIQGHARFNGPRRKAA